MPNKLLDLGEGFYINLDKILYIEPHKGGGDPWRARIVFEGSTPPISSKEPPETLAKRLNDLASEP